MVKGAGFTGIIEFVASVEAGSFSAAARRLGVSVAHVSRAVSAKETELNCQLIVRDTRNSILTEQGHEFYKHCRNIVDAYDEALDAVQGVSDASGLIRMSMGGFYAETVLSALVAQFCARHPRIRVELDMTVRNVALLEENFHLAVRIGPLSETSYIARKLVSFPIVTLVRSDHYAARLGSPTELHPEDCLALGGRAWRFQWQDQIETIEPNGKLSTNSGSALLKAAVEGLGVVHLPDYYGRIERSSGQLIQLFPEWVCPDRFDLYLVYPEQRHVPRRLRLLIDHLVESVES